MTENSEQAPGNDWDKRAAGWRAATKAQAPRTTGPNAVLMEAAELMAGQKVLDLASGTGEPALAIAGRIEPGGHVTALDSSAGMLDTARERAEAFDIRNVEFHQARMEELPFEDNSFDVVTCRFGLMLCDDPAAALREARRVLVAGGRIAVLVHGPRERNMEFDIVRKTMLEILGREEDAAPLRRFHLSGEGELTALFDAAGFRDVEEWEASEMLEKPVGEPFWAAMLKRSFSRDMADFSEEERADVDARLAQAFAHTIRGDAYHLLSTERVARARA